MTDLSTVEWSDLLDEVGRRIGNDIFTSAVEMFDTDREYYAEEGLSEQVVVSDSEEMIDEHLHIHCAVIAHVALDEFRKMSAKKYS